jgi:transposase
MIEYSGKKGEIQMVQRSYTAEFKVDAVKLAQEIGSSAAARELKIPTDTVYTWVSKAKNGSLPQSPIPPDPKHVRSMAERVKELEQQVKILKSENAQIMKENQILEDAAAFFAARRKK